MSQAKIVKSVPPIQHRFTPQTAREAQRKSCYNRRLKSGRTVSQVRKWVTGLIEGLSQRVEHLEGLTSVYPLDRIAAPPPPTKHPEHVPNSQVMHDAEPAAQEPPPPVRPAPESPDGEP